MLLGARNGETETVIRAGPPIGQGRRRNGPDVHLRQ